MAEKASIIPRTSETDPLLIGEIRLTQSPMTLGITMCPGRKGISMTGPDWDRDAGLDLEVIRAWRPDRLIHIMTPGMSYPPIGATDTIELPHYGVPHDRMKSFITSMLNEWDERSARWLIVSDQGLLRPAYLAAGFLKALGESGDHEQMINLARPEAYVLEDQRHFAGRIKTRWVDRMRQHSSAKSPQSEHEGILYLKDQAKELRASGKARSHSAALEMVARLFDFRDWNTARALIQRQSRMPWIYLRDFQAVTYENEELALQALGIDGLRCDADKAYEVCASDPFNFIRNSNGEMMWEHRSLMALKACIPVIVSWHERMGLPVSLETILNGYIFIPNVGLEFYLKSGLMGECDKRHVVRLIEYMQTLPGFDFDDWMVGRRIPLKTIELHYYTQMSIQASLREISDPGRSSEPREDPVQLRTIQARVAMLAKR